MSKNKSFVLFCFLVLLFKDNHQIDISGNFLKPVFDCDGLPFEINRIYFNLQDVQIEIKWTNRISLNW